jgi:hypothetical protein
MQKINKIGGEECAYDEYLDFTYLPIYLPTCLTTYLPIYLTSRLFHIAPRASQSVPSVFLSRLRSKSICLP